MQGLNLRPLPCQHGPPQWPDLPERHSGRSGIFPLGTVGVGSVRLTSVGDSRSAPGRTGQFREHHYDHQSKRQPNTVGSLPCWRLTRENTPPDGSTHGRQPPPYGSQSKDSIIGTVLTSEPVLDERGSSPSTMTDPKPCSTKAPLPRRRDGTHGQLSTQARRMFAIAALQ